MSVSILKALTQQEKLQATIKKYKNWAGSLKDESLRKLFAQTVRKYLECIKLV